MDELLGSGFKALPVKYSDESTVLRWLFMKQHTSRDKVPEKPSNKTLFVVSIPPFCDESSLKDTFSTCGPVQRVFCHAKPTASVPGEKSSPFFDLTPPINTYKVAYVVFQEPEGLQRALKYDSQEPLMLKTVGKDLNAGIVKWSKEYNSKIIHPGKLQEDIDLFMAKFDAEEAERDREAEKLGEADEEGWVTVTHKSKKRRIARTEGVRKKILESERRKRSRRELKNFYTFQIRESKMKHIETLRKKFEEDKKRINAFKQSRKFKPF